MTPTDLKAWRARMGYTQIQAAQAMGVSYRTYVALEQGWRDIQPYHVRLIELQMQVAELIEGN